MVQLVPLGFVVEGQCEFDCFQSLVSMVLGVRGLHTKLVNARGCGNIVMNLPENLDGLLRACRPHSVVVSVDLMDCIRQNLCTDCAALRRHLLIQYRQWHAARCSDSRYVPLPKNVSVVIQDKTFETWFLADPSGMNASGILAKQLPPDLGAVDSSIANPCQYLRGFMPPGRGLKNPKTAKQALHHLDASEMRRNSRSFDKFARDLEQCYAEYLECAGYTA